MNLLDSLLDAIVRLDGDALVMHVGEKPYVVTTSEATNEFRGPLAWGQVELSSRVLTVDAVSGMLGQILPLDHRSALDDYGATEYEVTAANNSQERFTIIAARGGDDIWLEVRRHPQPKPEPVVAPAEVAPADVAVAGEQPVAQNVHEPMEAPLPESAAEVAAPAQSEVAVAELALPVEVSAAEVSVAKVVVAASHAPEVQPPEPVEEVIEIEPFTFDVEAELTAAEDLGDLMTEGDLSELLRASAAAVITGEDREHESFDWLKEEAISDLGAQLFGAPDNEAGAAEAPEPEPETPAAVVDVVEPTPIGDLHVPIPVGSSIEEDVDQLQVETAVEMLEEPTPAVVDAHESLWEPEVSIPMEEEQPSPGVEFIEEEQPRVAAQPSIMFAGAAVSASAKEPVDVHVAETPAFEKGIAEIERPPVTEPSPAEEQEPADTPIAVDEEVAARRPPAIVVPLPRKADTAVGARAAAPTLHRLLRLAAARGAATVYVVAQSAPMVRVDGEFSTLDDEAALSAVFIERLIAEVLPAGRDASSTSSEWPIDVPEIGRVRCMTFRDHRGPGVIFRMVPSRAIAADQLGLSAEVQALSTEADGLILVTGARGSGKSTLLTSFVDLINRTRSDHVITTESQIEFVHENKRSFVSQREVRGDGDAFVAAVRAACREESDVLVIDDMRSPEIVALALEAAESGRLVLASVPGLSIASALERIIELFPADRREMVQASLAGTLRGVVSQVLLRKLRGGRVAAREVLINTPPVTSLILEGKIFQLPAAIENGGRAGMTSFAESLAALVREGTVHPSHAYRKAPNREQFLAILRREGVDISVAERLA